ncbi:MAG: hypothetical protein JSV33_16005 [bacterium]|nr:MAG: hypothetical protein JSV33_16005 [bacterium]
MHALIGIGRRRSPFGTLLLYTVFIAGIAFAGDSPGATERYVLSYSPCGPFVIHHPKRLSRMVEHVSTLLCEAVGEIASDLGLEAIDSITVFLAPDGESYQRLHRAHIPEWGAAFSSTGTQTLGINTEAVLRSPRPMRMVIRHELSHLLLAQRIEGIHCPLWFMEGLAMIHSHEWDFRDQWGLMSAAWKKQLPYLDDLVERFPREQDEAVLAYRLSYTAVERLVSERPDVLITLTAFIRELESFDRAFLVTFGETTDEFDIRLHEAIMAKYRTSGTLIQTMPYWLLLTCLFLLTFLIKRYRGRQKLETWEAEETEGPKGTAPGAFN